MNPIQISLTVQQDTGDTQKTFSIRRLVCAGWVGRDRKALQAHIDELHREGVSPPNRIPSYMNLSPRLITTSDAIEVISERSSGEVEYVVLKDADRLYVGVGSDHTDREFERFGIPASKQMYPKVMAPLVWPYEEIKPHWDQIILRSWSTSGGSERIYQENTLGAILALEALMNGLPREDQLPTDGMALFSGTIPTKGGMGFGERFEFEMEDPVLGRKIRHGYSVHVLPQYI